jgi:hypothetical protein
MICISFSNNHRLPNIKQEFCVTRFFADLLTKNKVDAIFIIVIAGVDSPAIAVEN